MNQQKIINFVQPQIDVFKDKSNILLVDGPTGNGKSTIIQEKLHAYLKRFPKSNGLIIRKSLESTKNSVVLRYINEICDREPGVVWYNEDDSRFEYNNGSYLFVAGVKNEAQRKALKGIGSGGSIHFIVVEEAAELLEYDFDEIVSRCRGDAPAGYRQIILTCNPEGEDHWINQKFILPFEHLPSLADGYIYNKSKTVTRITWSTEFNPSADDVQLNNLKNLSGVYYNRNYLGKWVSATGVVYPDFRRAVHQIPSFDIPSDWERVRSIDFGGSDAANVCIWFAQRPEDKHLFVYKYIYRIDMTTPEFADLIHEVNDKDRILYTVADHQANERRYLGSVGIPTILANKDIPSGLKAVTQRLRINHPTLFFFEDALNNGKDIIDVDPKLRNKKRAKNGIEEFSNYTWARDNNGRAKDVPIDRDNDFCFISGTMVETIDGNKPIESIEIGDVVLTMDGYRKVSNSMMTNQDATICELLLSDGTTLYGTPNHPIFSNGKYTPLHDLRYGDIIETSKKYKEMFQCLNPEVDQSKKFNIKALSSDVIQNQNGAHLESILCQNTRRINLVLNRCINKYGLISMDKYPMVITFTILTIMRLIMIFQTLSAYRAQSILNIMVKKCLKIGEMPFGLEYQNFKSWLKFGTLQKRVVNGIVNMRKMLGKTSKNILVNVNSAALNSRLHFQPGQDSVLITANLKQEDYREWITKQEYANVAEKNLSVTNIPKPKTVPVHVVAVTTLENRQPVYNITVHNPGGKGHYFANGICVSNCDALRYGIMAIDRSKFGGTVITPADVEEMKQKMIKEKLNNNNNGIVVF